MQEKEHSLPNENDIANADCLTPVTVTSFWYVARRVMSVAESRKDARIRVYQVSEKIFEAIMG
jgi:hypothetical protein